MVVKIGARTRSDVGVLRSYEMAVLPGRGKTKREQNPSEHARHVATLTGELAVIISSEVRTETRRGRDGAPGPAVIFSFGELRGPEC